MKKELTFALWLSWGLAMWAFWLCMPLAICISPYYWIGSALGLGWIVSLGLRGYDLSDK